MTRYRPLSLPLSLVGMLLTSAWPSMALAQPIAPEFASVWNFFVAKPKIAAPVATAAPEPLV